MSKPALFYFDFSPVSRSVLLTVKALNLDVEYKVVDLMANEQLSPEFLAINPQHTVPTLVDAGKSIWDSHAINAFLVTKYGETDALYPKEAYARAAVDQRLHFHSSVLFSRFSALIRPVFFGDATEWDDEAVEKLTAAFDFVEIFLGDNQYVAGSQLTIADFACLPTISSTLSWGVFEENRFPKVSAWVKRLQQLPYYHEANGATIEEVLVMLEGKLPARKTSAQQ